MPIGALEASIEDPPFARSGHNEPKFPSVDRVKSNSSLSHNDNIRGLIDFSSLKEWMLASRHSPQ